MTDIDEDTINPDDLWTLEPYRRTDVMLEALVEVCAGPDEMGQTALGITVSLKGQLISGLLCSYGSWIDALRAAKTGSEQARIFMGELLNGFENLKPQREEGKDNPPRQYFYLKDATIWQGGTQMKLGTLRGRLSEVDGWSFGGFDTEG